MEKQRYDFTANADLRDEIIFHEPFDENKYSGGIRRFDYMNLDTLKQLVDGGYADPDSRQNGSPSIKTILAFMEKYPQVTCSGYTVSPFRMDYRVSIDEINCLKDINTDLIKDFSNSFHDADEFTIENDFMRAWYD